jgi:hypothetical protein
MLLLTCLGRALQRHRDPLVVVDAIRQATLVVRRGAEAVLGDRAEGVTLRQALDGVLDRARGPELLLGELGRLLQLPLVPDLQKDDVPGEQGHQDEDDQRAFGNEVSLGPERPKPYGLSTTVVAAFSMGSSA